MKQFIRLAIIVCILITAGIHLALAIAANLPMFYANAIGYLILGMAYANIGIHLPHNNVRFALQAYTALTIVLWMFFGDHSLIAYIDKIIEVFIVGLLWYAQRID